MEYAVLGRSQLVGSVIGLGGGGPSRFGLSTGSTAAEAVALIRRAYDLGVTLFDGAGLLGGVDSVLGKAVKPFRKDVVLSTKINLAPVCWPLDRHRTLHRGAARVAQALSLTASARTVRGHVERTLKQLETDYIDILHLHALTIGQYPLAIETAVPVLAELKRKGVIRAIGTTEAFPRDPDHRMLARALEDGFPDVVMAGFNMLNRSARLRVVPPAERKGIGVLGMFTMRSTLGRDAHVAKSVREDGQRRAEALMPVLRDNGIERLTDAAIRFSRHERGVNAVLLGTGNLAHLEQNVAAALAPPLPEPVLAAIEAL
jgi:L-galactose dehydrogenase